MDKKQLSDLFFPGKIENISVDENPPDGILALILKKQLPPHEIDEITSLLKENYE